MCELHLFCTQQVHIVKSSCNNVALLYLTFWYLPSPVSQKYQNFLKIWDGYVITTKSSHNVIRFLSLTLTIMAWSKKFVSETGKAVFYKHGYVYKHNIYYFTFHWIGTCNKIERAAGKSQRKQWQAQRCNAPWWRKEEKGGGCGGTGPDWGLRDITSRGWSGARNTERQAAQEKGKGGAGPSSLWLVVCWFSSKKEN